MKENQPRLFNVPAPALEEEDHGAARALGQALSKQLAHGRGPAGSVTGPLFDPQLTLDNPGTPEKEPT